MSHSQPRLVSRLWRCMTLSSSGAVTTLASASSTRKIFASRSLSSCEMLGTATGSEREKRRPVGVVCTADSEVEGLRLEEPLGSISSTRRGL